IWLNAGSMRPLYHRCYNTDMTLSKLLFELSGETRLEMLHALEAAPLTFTKIADQMDITSSEASRQIERLSGMNLIEKLSDGSYAITPLGRLMLSFLPGIGFVYENSDFFRTHDTAPIPHELIMRFGDLSGATFIEGTIETMNFVQERMRNAERYHYGMVDGLMRMMIPLAVEKIRSGVRFGMILPDAYREELSAIVNEYSDEGERVRTIEIRTLASVPLCVGVTDRGCGFKLPSFDGEIDHSAMVVGTGPAFCNWCHDLHAHYWERASPV
ncbi:MAG: transcriptional regulator FilR1 domain-containing protein, partial [Euryarchaeota archaeon]|nr:transcriptional regulator FilR1 domain-containing protein [Euryarchaeota archaeon]